MVSIEVALAGETIRPLKRVEYDRLVELGMFEDERLELLHGVLVAMTPQGPAHAWTIQQLTERLVLAVGGRASVRVQSPLSASDDSVPEPDVAVVARTDYSRAHPATALLGIEVAETSQRRDRELKARLYAAAGIPEYWLCDLPTRTIEVRTQPAPDGYRQLDRRDATQTVSPTAFPDIVLPVNALLPC